MPDSRSSWRPARVIENRPVADGSMWLVLEAVDEFPAAFEPGHVLGLGIDVDGSIMRHAYTVSRGTPSTRRFEHLYRVIRGGRLSPQLAQLATGDKMYFHGPFHTPIQQEVRSAAERIVLMSTGAGIGPIFGFAEKTLREGESRPITLYAGFRTESDTCLEPELAHLAQSYPNFAWQFTLTKPSGKWNGLTGRVTEYVPALIDTKRLETYHFHLVGNGEMVNLTRNALHLAGVPSGQVSIETYFNHYVQPPREEVERLGVLFSGPQEEPPNVT
jgi:ferredoxin-NADP reductase